MSLKVKLGSRENRDQPEETDEEHDPADLDQLLLGEGVDEDARDGDEQREQDGERHADFDAAIPAAVVKACACGAVYDGAGWKRLTLVGRQVIPADEDEPELVLELRNCPCPGSEIPSTLAIEVVQDYSCNPRNGG